MAAGSSQEQPDPYLEQAFDWLIRVEEAPGDSDLRRALDAWKAADPRHAEAWRRARRIWGLVGEVPPDVARWPAESAPAPATTAPELGRHRRRRLGGRVATAAAAALAACLVVVLWPTIELHVRADYSTAVGETRRIMLDDGSVVHLGADSAISTDYGTQQRRVRLLSGQAFFEVAANRERPFVVNADDLDVTVLGTAFDIHLGQRLYAVSVQHGSVAVHYDNGHGAVDEQLAPGQRLRIVRQDGASELDHVSPDNVAAWRHGRLSVHDRTVADVAETLQRYYHGYILVPDDALAERRVTGSYNLDNPDLALRGLVEPYHGRVRELTPLLRILQAP